MKYIFISENAPIELTESLAALGFTPIRLPKYSALASAVASHCDMLIYPMNGGILTYRGYFEENRELFAPFNVAVADITPSEKYPNDIALNALSLGGKIYCLRDKTARKIIESGETVNVRQGYARCSTLKLDEQAIITADISIANAAAANGIEVTLIGEGNIALDGYDYGFIGGASASLGDMIGFFGEPELHPEYKKIAAAIERRGKRIVSLCGGGLTDYGGAQLIE